MHRIKIEVKRLSHSWVVAFAAASILAVHALVLFTFGVFFKPLTTEFHWSRGALSGTLSMYLLLIGILGIFTGRLSDKHGPRILITTTGLLTGIGFLLMSQINSLWQVYLIWGVLMGIGGSCCFTPLYSTIPRWFEEKRGMAIGIIAAGYGLGAVVSPPLAQWLLSTYDWQWAFIILGLVTFLIVVPLAQLMRHSHQRAGIKRNSENGTLETIGDRQPPNLDITGSSFMQAVKAGHFWVFGITVLCFFCCLQAINAHIVPHITDIEIPEVVAASILSLSAGTSIISRFSIGFISDKVGGKLTLSACLAFATLALTWLIFIREIWSFYMFAVLFGIAYGGMVPLITIVAVELFGVSFLGMILGGVMLLCAIGEALGPVLAGSIFDITGSYSLAFLICVVLSSLALILSLVLLRRYKEMKYYAT